MADSDSEYDEPASGPAGATHTDGTGHAGGAGARPMASRPKARAQARWEASAANNLEDRGDNDADIEGALEAVEEAGKRRRSVSSLLESY